ncbi:MAG: diguanylate cyclase [Campylobacteraceae bacterium]|nr:diguanylate cyclase [Campylobacteraceae bacterium]
MKTKLKKITDKTVQDLLQNEIILPSSYFESFDKNAKDIKVDITDSDFEKEVSEVLVQELKVINEYMKKTIKNIDNLSKATEEAQVAIQNKDESKLNSINSSLNDIKEELESLKGLVYLDSLTKVYNRKWVYNQAIEEDGTFGYKGILLFIDITDFNYIVDKYGNLIADNVIIYISKFLSQKLKKEGFAFEIARYSNDQFVLFIKDDKLDSIITYVNNLRLEFSNSTLKSKSGLTFKTNFTFGATRFTQSDDFQRILEKVAAIEDLDFENIKGTK